MTTRTPTDLCGFTDAAGGPCILPAGHDAANGHDDEDFGQDTADDVRADLDRREELVLVEDHGLPLISFASAGRAAAAAPRPVALPADPLGTTDDGLPLAQECRVCGCTDYNSCRPDGCSWIVDPIGLGPLCSRCLEIAVSVTDQDAEAMATYDPAGRRPHLVYAPGAVEEDHGAWLLGSVISFGCSGMIVGAVIGIAIAVIFGWTR